MAQPVIVTVEALMEIPPPLLLEELPAIFDETVQRTIDTVEDEVT